MSESATIDPVTLTVIDNYLTSTCRDMGVTMMKTSYSPIFNESLDFSCVIFDPAGADAGSGRVLPIADRDDQVHRHLDAGRARARRVRTGRCRDPRRSVSRLRTRSRAHDAQTGLLQRRDLRASSRMSPTCPSRAPRRPEDSPEMRPRSSRKDCSCRRSRSSERGEDVRDIWKIILANHRTPKVTYGDFRAMMASLDLAEAADHRTPRQRTGSRSGPRCLAGVDDHRRTTDAGRNSRQSRTASTTSKM